MKGVVQASDLGTVLAAASQVSHSPDPVRFIFERIDQPIDSVEPDTEDRAVEAGHMRIIAYNETITAAEWRIPAEITRSGSVAIVLDGLANLVKASKNAESSFIIETTETENEDALRLTTSRSAHEFPQVSQAIFETLTPRHTTGGRADLGNVARAISTVEGAKGSRADTQGAKIVLTGVHLRLQDDTLDVVATDGRRIAISKLNRTDLGAISFEDGVDRATLPSDALPLVVAMLQAGPARFDISATTATIENATGSLSFKLIEPAFPEYGPLLQTPTEHAVTLTKSDLEIALKRSSVSITRDRTTVAVKLTTGEDGVFLTSSVGGQSSSECITSTAAEPSEIGFDAKFMLSAIAHLGPQDIALKYSTHTLPIFVTSPARPEVTMLVMPCRV